MHAIWNIRVRTRLLLGFAGTLLAMFLLAGLFWNTLGSMKARLDAIVTHDYRQFQQANTARDAIRDQSIALRDITLQEDVSLIKGEIQRFKEARTHLNTSLEQLQSASGDAFSDQIAKVRANAELCGPIIDAVREAALSDDSAGREKARTLVRDDLRPLQTAQIAALEEILSGLENRTKASAEKARTTQNRVIAVSALLTIFALLLGVVMSLFITRSITTPLALANTVCDRIANKDLGAIQFEKRSDELGQLLGNLESMRINLLGALQQVRQSAGAVAKSIHDIHLGASTLASHADEQDLSAEAISQTVTRLSTTMAAISESARNMDEQARQSQQLAQHGAEEIESERDASRQLIITVNQTRDTVQNLSEAVREISTASSTISEIADQTNLLALNAAIEAARAGEQGRGFAVVADEVRKLAEKTAGSTASIAGSIARISAQVSHAVEAMRIMQQDVMTNAERAQAAEEALGQIVVASNHLQEQAGAIARAISEQECMSQDAVTHTASIRTLSQESTEKLHLIHEELEQVSCSAAELENLVQAFHME